MKDPSDANRQALEQQLRDLQQAIERHMQALMEEAQRNHEELPFDPDSQHLSDRDFERMAEAAREAAREGHMDEAQQRMAELERMLDQLRNARAEHGKAAQQRARATPARAPADERVAGHDRAPGRLAGPRAEPFRGRRRGRGSASRRRPSRPIPTPSARRTGGCSRRCGGRWAS